MNPWAPASTLAASFALSPAPSFLLSLAAIYAIATLAAVSLQSRARAVSYPAPVAVLFCPLLIPPDEAVLRAAASILSINAMFRLVELLRMPRALSPQARLSFLIPLPIFVALMDQRRRMRRRGCAFGKEGLRLLGGGVAFLGLWLILNALAQSNFLRSNHLADHTLKLALFVAAVELGAQALCGLERIVGYRTRPMVRNAWLSSTPAEFWRRWNDRVHAWLVRHVFRSCGGRARPARAICCVCLFSGAFHELMFGIATSRFDGYQFAFFAVQAPAIMASGRMKVFARRGGAAGAVWLATFLWLWATSFLFFHGINRVAPMYYASEPWLP